jgi:pheromone a factor receptor
MLISGEQDFHGRPVVFLMCSCSRRHWSDPTISNKHVRIHCILYEQDHTSGIPPFVYATDMSSNGTFLKKKNTECASSQGEGVLMGRNNGSFLLDNEDELRISESVALVYFEYKATAPQQLTSIQEREKQFFASQYLVTGRLLGKGGYGKVFVGIHQKTQKQLACKVINLRGLYGGTTAPNLRLPKADRTQESLTTVTRKRWPSKVARCFREFDVLKDISHPNIINIAKVFWSSATIYIFEELITGGDLFSYIEYKRGSLADVEAAIIIRQILIGIEFLHKHGIVHRDLKPDNVLMTSLEDGARIVITDFGNARCIPQARLTPHPHLGSKRRMFSLVGTLEFAAPEIHNRNPTIPAEQGYSKAVDMWSVGSITAAVLTGDVIFTDRGHPDYEKNPFEIIVGLAAQCDISIIDDEDHPAWSKVGNMPKDFITKLLVLREEGRLTATQALAHPWFSNPRHAPEFEALYKRSIRDWKPREKVVDLVECIQEFPQAARERKIRLSRHFAPTSRQRLDPNNHERITPQYSVHNRIFTPVAEEYQGDRFECPSSYEQQSYDQSSYCSESRDNSINQLPVDSNPPASDMYLAHEAQPKDLYEEIASEVEVEDSQQGDGSQPRMPETQTDSLVVFETPEMVGTKRPTSSEDLLPPYETFFSREVDATGYPASKKRKPASGFH